MIQIEMPLYEYPADRIEMGSSSLFWKREPDDRLVHSLQANGQCTPILVEPDQDVLRLVAGQRRVQALAKLGQPVMACHVRPLTPWQRGLVFLDSNIGQPLDDALMIRALRYFADSGGDLEEISPLLGVESRSRQWQLMLQWMDIPPLWDDLLDRGHVPLALGRIFSRFTPEGLCAVEPLFRELSWSKNNAVHLITWVWELSRSKKMSPEILLKELKLDAVLHLDLSPKDMMLRVLTVVRNERFPRLSALEHGFKNKAAEVTEGSRWRLVQPDRFETGTVEFLARIRSKTELEQRVQELKELASHDLWDDLQHAGEAE